MGRVASCILKFTRKAQRLKRIQRKGWVRAGVKKPESVADHSYACAMLSMIVGDLYGLDTERLIRMALLHDLPESIMGDLTPRQKKMLGFHTGKLEKRAATATMTPLPSRTKRRYLALIDEYGKQASKESRLLRDIDKIEMSLQALAYIKEGYAARNMTEFLKSTEKDLKTNIGRALFETFRHAKRT